MSRARCFLACCCLLGGGPAWGAEGDEFLRVVEGFAQLETLAGSGLNEDPLDNNDWLPEFEGGPALDAELSNPHYVAADALGRVYIADKASHSVLRIEPDGRIFTHAGTHEPGLVVTPSAPATSLPLDSPNGLYVKPDGTVFIYDTNNQRVRRVAPDGTMTTVVHDPSPLYSKIGRGLWVSPDEKTIVYADGRVLKKWSDGVFSVVATGFLELGNIDVHPITGLVYVTDRATADVTQSAVWRIEADGSRTRVAGNGRDAGGGDGFPATETFLDQVRGIAFTPQGGYFLCTHKGGDIWYVDTTGIIHLFIRGQGNKNQNDGNGLSPPITEIDALSEPRSVALAPNGDLLIATNDTGYIRRVRSAVRPPAPDWLSVEIPRAGRHRLSWTSAPGRPYLIERGIDLNPSRWEVMAVAVPDGPVGEWSGPGLPEADHLFYRIAPPR